MTSKINVLHLLLSLETGGMERFVYEHCLAIDKEKFNVSVCCIDRLGGFSDSLVAQGIKVDLLQKSQKHFDLIFPLILGRYLRKHKIQILHIHTGAFFHGSIAGFLAKTSGILYTEHGRHLVEPKIIFLLDKISSVFVDRIITVSPDLERHLIKKIKLPARKIITIINGVNIKYFKPREKSKALLAEFRLEADSKIVGTVGRLADIKNHAMLINAFKIVQEKLPESRLLLVGEGPCENDLKKLAYELGLSEFVIFTGNRSDISEILNLFDIFVLSSLMEGTSLSLLEAMASGVPPVVTNVGGNPNVVRNNYHGYVVEPNDYRNMSNKIVNILMDEELRKSFAKNVVDHVSENYSHSTNVSKYSQLYIDVLKE